jgi:hypothetical protein
MEIETESEQIYEESDRSENIEESDRSEQFMIEASGTKAKTFYRK